MSTLTELKPPEEMFNGDHLPEDLKWLMTHFDLPKDDPTIVFCAWHWSRVRHQYEFIYEGAMLFKTILDPRLAKVEAYAALIEKMQPGLDRVANVLGQDEASLKGKLHEGLEKPMDQITQRLEKLVSAMERQWWELTWKQWLACFIAGMATASILILCAS